MDGKAVDGFKLWRCKNEHVLGIVERVQVSSNGGKYHVARLRLFRQAVDMDDAFTLLKALADMDVIGSVEGTVMDIRCSVPGCGEVRTWWMGEASLERFLERRKENTNV